MTFFSNIRNLKNSNDNYITLKRREKTSTPQNNPHTADMILKINMKLKIQFLTYMQKIKPIGAEKKIYTPIQSL